MYILHLELVSVPNKAETLDLLIRYVINTWDRLKEEPLNRLIDTMERRVKAVIEAKGWQNIKAAYNLVSLCIVPVLILM